MNIGSLENRNSLVNELSLTTKVRSRITARTTLLKVAPSGFTLTDKWLRLFKAGSKRTGYLLPLRMKLERIIISLLMSFNGLLCSPTTNDKALPSHRLIGVLACTTYDILSF
jgi:hypothetical protein